MLILLELGIWEQCQLSSTAGVLAIRKNIEHIIDMLNILTENDDRIHPHPHPERFTTFEYLQSL